MRLLDMKMTKELLLDRKNDIISNKLIDILIKIHDNGGYKIGHIKPIQKIIVSAERFLNRDGRRSSKLARILHWATGNSTFYLDYENGSDSNDGSTWALAWKTITSGATAARIAPGDVIRIAKSPAPYSIGNATWTDLSKTVTLAGAQTANIDMCESIWTKNASGDITPTLISTASDGKEGSYCSRLTFDSSPQTSIMQAYFATGTLDLSSYQKISLWIKTSGAITAGTLRIALCSDTAGATPVDYFDIPAIPSSNYWAQLTLTKSGGGNLGSSIQSIALYTNSSVSGLASRVITFDDIIACTTSGLNLQSLISKNSAEQGGAEPWMGIKSINGTEVILDNETASLPGSGKGYCGDTETVATYARETIKTTMGSATSTQVQATQDSGTLAAGDIEYQGGYDTSTSLQTGETFFDGQNGLGYGLYVYLKYYLTINRLSFCRYYEGIYVYMAKNITFTVIPSISNNSNNGIWIRSSYFCLIQTILNARNNFVTGVQFYAAGNNVIESIDSADGNANYGLQFSTLAAYNIVKSANIRNCTYGASFYGCSGENFLYSLTTSNNASGGVQAYDQCGINYLIDATIAESTKVAVSTEKVFTTIYSKNQDSSANYAYKYNGYMYSITNDRSGGAGLKWRLSPNTSAATDYPFRQVLAEIPVNADAQVTVTIYCKRGSSNLEAKLMCRGGQIAGVTSDVSDSAAGTDWDQLQIQFTPTESGVVEIEAFTYHVTGGVSYADFADIEVSQA